MGSHSIVVGKFRPPEFGLRKMDWPRFDALTGRHWRYAANGKACLYHILRSVNASGRILVPVYICDTVLTPIRRLGLEVVPYDVDPIDLNPSTDSLCCLLDQGVAKVAVVASLYGNAADLGRIEDVCRRKNVFLIDDAAQSFGARLDGRLVGTFGNAGFFSLSPGKSLSAHMGGAFWSERPCAIERTSHIWTHLVIGCQFYVERYKGDRFAPGGMVRGMASRARRWCEGRTDLYNDRAAPLEDFVLGGVLGALLDGDFAFRQKHHDRFPREFVTQASFRPVVAVRGAPHNHKLVLVASSSEVAEELMRFMGQRGIYAGRGYRGLPGWRAEAMPGMSAIDGRVVELPIENDDEKMAYVLESLAEFRGKAASRGGGFGGEGGAAIVSGGWA